jgi:hypothetical protein
MVDDPNSAGWMGHAHPDLPRTGTDLTTRVRPGARKPGPKRKRDKKPPSKSALELHEKVRADIAREHAKVDFGRRCAELRQQGKQFAEIAVIMSEERGQNITHSRVKQGYNAYVSNVAVTDRTRNEEVTKLEDAAAKVWQRLVDMESEGPGTLDVEVYAKVAETYLKYRERISKLLGLDAAVKQIVQRDGAPAPGQGMSIDLDSNGLRIRMPGSIDAFQEWEQLSEAGLTQLAADVIELEEGDHEELPVGTFHDDRAKAGVTLSPGADTTSKADRVATALEALEALKREAS